MKYCYKCKQNKTIDNFNKDKYSNDGLQNKCKYCKKLYAEKYKLKNQQKYINNREEKIEYQINYYNLNKEKRIQYQIKYQKEKYKNNSLYRLSVNLRSRIYLVFKNKNYIKNKTKLLLGADLKTIKNHLESTFDKNMSWSNYGDWHIDHIIPLSIAVNKEEMIKLCHYTNLQALWAKDNLQKSNKILL